MPPATGGDTRQRSVLNGLRALAPHAPDRVLIHDGVRPFVTADIIERVLSALDHTPGAIAAIPLADTLKRADAGRRVAETVGRSGLWRAQTPQGFRFADILAAHEAAAAAGRNDLTDDAAVAEWAGLAVTLVDGSEANRKLTTAEDLAMVQNPDTRPCRRAHRAGLRRASLLGGRSRLAVRRARLRIPTASKGTPTPMSGCMRSPMPCWAPSATATSASISPIRMRAGRVRLRTCSSPTRLVACALAAASSPTST